MARLADHARHLFGPADVIHFLYGRGHNSGDVRFLEGIGIASKCRHLTRHNHQRHIVTMCVRDGRNGIGRRGTRRHDTNADPAGGPRIPHGGPRRTRFGLKDGHLQVLCFLQGIHSFHNGAARERHDLRDALSPQQGNE